MDEAMFETPEGNVEQKQKSIQFLRKLQLGDLCFRDLMMYGLIMLGKTKAGKTTLAHHLIKNSLKGNQDETYQLNGGIRFTEAIIGHSDVSQTQIPNQITSKLSQVKSPGEHKNISPEKSFKQSGRNSSKQQNLIKKQSDSQNNEIHIIDCPGYSDSKGCHMQIANGYFHYRVFSKVKNIKFVLVMDYNFFSGIAQKPADTIIQFLMSFKNLRQIKDSIIGATSFVFTKLKKYNKQSDDQIREYIKNKLNLLKESSVIQKIIQYRDVLEELIETVIQKKRYYFFEKAQANVIAPANDLLVEICRNTSYWSRDLQPEINEVDMSHIQMTLGRKCFDEASKNKQFSQDYKSLMNEFNERFSTAIAYSYKRTNLAKITEIFLLNSLYAKGTNIQYNQYVEKYHPDLYMQHANEKDYYTLIQQFNRSFNIYSKDQKEGKAKEYATKRGQLKGLLTKCPHSSIDRSQISQIQKLEIAKMIMDVVSIKEEILVNDRSLARLRFISHKILSVLAQLKKIKMEGFNKEQQTKYIQTIQQFYYIIFRLLQQARVFKILFTFQVSPSEKQQLDQVLLKNVDSIQILFDYSQALTNQKYYNVGLGKQGSIEKIKAHYFSEVYQAKPDQSSSYYFEIDNYFDDMVITNKKMLREIQKKRILLRKNNIDKNAKEFQKRKDYKLLELVKNTRSAAKIALMQGLNSNQNTENIQLILNQLNELGYQLSKIQQKISEKVEDVRIYLKAAIEAFKSTKNVYKCIESYQKLVNRYDDKNDANSLLGILDEYAQYCAKNGRIQLSIEIYQHAFSIVDFMKIENESNLVKQKIQKRKEISKKIGMIGISKKYSPSDAYYEQMMKYTIYDEIDFAVFDRIQILLSTVQ